VRKQRKIQPFCLDLHQLWAIPSPVLPAGWARPFAIAVAPNFIIVSLPNATCFTSYESGHFLDIFWGQIFTPEFISGGTELR
jgi:hypothetical protein